MAKAKRPPKKVKKKMTKKRVVSGPKASEEFGSEIYSGDDWKDLKKRHPRGFETTIVDIEKIEYEDGHAWYASLEGHDRLAKISKPSGRRLGEVFGDDMGNWKGKEVHVMPTKYQVGWGAVIEPLDGETENEAEKNEDGLEEDDQDDADLIDEDDELD